MDVPLPSGRQTWENRRFLLEPETRRNRCQGLSQNPQNVGETLSDTPLKFDRGEVDWDDVTERRTHSYSDRARAFSGTREERRNLEGYRRLALRKRKLCRPRPPCKTMLSVCGCLGHLGLAELRCHGRAKPCKGSRSRQAPPATAACRRCPSLRPTSIMGFSTK
jgi:hypothetical protein